MRRVTAMIDEKNEYELDNDILVKLKDTIIIIERKNEVANIRKSRSEMAEKIVSEIEKKVK